MHTQSTQAAPRPVLPPLLARWLVQYNPFFTASALCVLVGVFVLSQTMGTTADLGLTALLDAYQWMVIGAAAVLYRRLGQRRPAVVLAIIQLLYMGDPTLQLAALASSSQGWASAAWVGSFILKMVALSWVFRLRVSVGVYVVPVLGAATIAVLPLLRVWGLASSEWLSGVLAAVVVVAGVVARLFPPKVESQEDLHGFALTVFHRAVKGAWWVWGGAAAYHAGNAALGVGMSSLVPALSGVMLLAALDAQEERRVWTRIGAALFLGTLGGTFVFAAVLGMTAIVLLLAAAGRPPRVITGAVVAAYCCLQVAVGSQLSFADQALLLAAVSLLFGWMVVTLSAWSALGAMGLLAVRIAAMAQVVRAPHSGMEWGVLLVGAGFVMIPVGVLLHGWMARGNGKSAPPLASPSTSVAISRTE